MPRADVVVGLLGTHVVVETPGSFIGSSTVIKGNFTFTDPSNYFHIYWIYKGYRKNDGATSVQNATNKIVNKLGGDTFILGAAAENYFAIWTDNANNTVSFSELETVFGGTNPISISEYRTQSGQTTAGSIITVSTHFKGKGVAPP